MKKQITQIKISSKFKIKGRDKTYSVMNIKGNDVTIREGDNMLNYQLTDIIRGIEITKNIEVI